MPYHRAMINRDREYRVLAAAGALDLALGAALSGARHGATVSSMDASGRHGFAALPPTALTRTW